jgi:hypothetical protein
MTNKRATYYPLPRLRGVREGGSSTTARTGGQSPLPNPPPLAEEGEVAARGAVMLCGLIATSLYGAAPAGAQSVACAAPQQPMQQIELVFGRNIGDRVGVGEAAWSRFLTREITPRFPDGLTVLNATGQWQDKDRGRLVREPSKLVVIVTADDTLANDKIAAIIAAYKQRFRQRSVGVISHPVCAVF